MVLWVWDRKIVTVVAASYHKITGESRQILFEALPSQTQDLHGFFLLCAATGNIRPEFLSAKHRQNVGRDAQAAGWKCEELYDAKS